MTTWLGALTTMCMLPAMAQDVEISWQDCVNMTLLHNRDLISAAGSEIQADADVISARSGLMPSLKAGASARTSDSDASVHSESYGYDVSVDQLVYDGGKTSHGLAAARARKTATHLQSALVSSDVRLNLRNAFVDLLRAQAMASLADEIAGRRDSNLKLVKIRYDAGREHKGSLKTAQANLAQATADVRQALRDIEVGRATLTAIMGTKGSQKMIAGADLELSQTLEQKPDFEKLMTQNPLVARLCALRNAAEHNLKSAKADYGPSVQLSAKTGRSGPDWPPDEESWSAGVSVSLPLFEGGRQKASVRNDRASLEQAQAEEAKGRDSVLLSLMSAWADLESAADTIEVRASFLEAAQERARIAEAQYSAGLVSFDNWIIIEDDLVRTQKAYVEARAAALKAEARWVQAKGGTLEDE